MGITHESENNSICIISQTNKVFEYDGQKYSYHKLSSAIINNQKGIEIKDNYRIATPERAFLDIIYLHRKYEFNNLYEIDWKKVEEILPIYDANIRMKKDIKRLFNSCQKDFG
jgi:hypothetical protein